MSVDLSDLRSVLLAGRNTDGGWGYYPGKTSRLEPTCWALLALGEQDDGTALRRWAARDGLLLERTGGDANFAFHGLALLAIRARAVEHEGGSGALLAGIQRAAGIALEPSDINRQNNALQGWSWIAGTFSWVEPTAWCLLALKKWAPVANPPVDAKRVADAEALLFDRCCVNGGWNYGNSNMLGQELAPYVPTTAVALLALQDHPAHPAFVRSVAWLEREALSERSGSALALALIALRALGRSAGAVSAALAGQLPTTLALHNHLGIAQALFALRTDHGDAAFVL